MSVTCTGTGGQATSQTIVNVPKKGDSGGNCLAIAAQGGGSFTRMTAPILTNRNDGISVNRDSTSFDSIFGNSSAPHWPGPFITTNMFLPTTNYASLAFTVPANFYGSGLNVGDIYGHYTINASQKTGNVSMSISTKCGDFSPPTSGGSTTLCVKNTARAGDYLGWWLTPGASCMLQNGQTYFLNIINADVSQVGPNGTGTATSTKTAKCLNNTCEDAMQNGPSHYFYP